MSPSPKLERAFHREHVTLNASGGVKVEETPDWWVIPDCILTTDGVMNGARKTREDLAQTWMLFNGIPQVHEHPDSFDEFGLVIDQRRLCGIVDNVRFDDKTGNVIGDYYLARRAMPGLVVTDAMLAANEATVTQIGEGKRVETSIGFWSSDEKLPAPVEYDGPNDQYRGQEYDRIQRFIVPDHNAFVPQGACGSTCSVGSAQANALHDHARAAQREHETKAREGENPARPQGDTRMATTPQELQAALDRLKQQAADSEKAVKAGCDKVAILEAENKELKATATRVTERLDAADKARLDAKLGELAKLVGKDAKDLPKMDEAALDFTIERERTFRGKADGSRIARGGDNADRPVKDGMQELPGGGFTVVDMNAVTPKAAVN